MATFYFYFSYARSDDRSQATAVLDTGTPLIEGPYDDVGALAEKIGAVCVTFASSSASSAKFVSAAFIYFLVLVLVAVSSDFGIFHDDLLFFLMVCVFED